MIDLTICPNFSHPDYKRAEEEFGKDHALLMYDWLGNRPPSEKEVELIKEGKTLTDRYNQRVWDTNKTEGLIERWHTVDGEQKPVLKKFSEKKADDKVMELRKKYYKDGIGFDKVPAEGKQYEISARDKKFVHEDDIEGIHIANTLDRETVVNEFADRDKEVQSEPFKNTIPVPDTEVQYPHDPEDSRKLEGIQREPETKEELHKKVEVLKKAIPQIENILYDETLPTIATLEPGGKTIRINPNLMTKDSIGHEYGHALIDLLGGMNNPMIKQGRAQLEGSDIEKEVMKAYPDLAANKDNRLDKEILTTAVGMKTAEIFKDAEIQNKWERWLVRFMRTARAKLGIESSVVLKLANQLVAGKPLASSNNASSYEIKSGMYEQGTASRYEQNSKNLNDHLSILNGMLKKEEEFQKRASLVLQKKLDVYSKKGRQTDAYKSLEDAMPRITGSDPTKGLVQMVRFAVSSTKEMNDKYIAYMKADRMPKEGSKEKFTAKLLADWRTSVSSWDMLEDLKQLYHDTRNQIEAFGSESDTKGLQALMTQNRAILEVMMGEKEFKAATTSKNTNILDLLMPMLDKAIDVKNDVQNLYVEKGKELMVDFLYPYVNHVKVWKREEYEKEWMNLTPDQQKEMSRSDYIANKMSENMGQIEKDTRDLILRELGKADGDIGILTRYLDTILNSKDVISSALARSVYGIHEKSRVESIEWHKKFSDRVTALEKQLGRNITTADEEFYGFMLEEDPEKKGRLMQTIVSHLPSKLIEDYYAFADTIWTENYKDNNGNKPSDEGKKRIISKWKEANAPRDKEAWKKTQTDFADELLKDKLISTDEHKKYLDNLGVTTKASRRPITKLIRNPEALDAIDSFNRRNEWTDRAPAGYYDKINSKWKALEAMRKSNPNDERVKFYDFISEVRDEAAARLPGKYALTTELPSMMKTIGQRYKATGALGMTKADFVKAEFRAKFMKQSTDTDRGMLDESGEGLNIIGKEKLAAEKAAGTKSAGEKTQLVNEANEPENFLPIFYTQNKSHDRGKWLPLQDQSFDVGSLYYNYLKMAVDFGNKYDVLAELEMTNYFINHRDVIRRDAKGNIYTDATASKLRNIGDNLRDKALVKSGTTSLIAAQVNDFMKMAIYGMAHDEEPDINILGYTIDRAKLLNSINSFTSLNLLGMNFIAGLATFNIVELNKVIESSSGQYYNMKEANHATGYYYKNLGGILKDIGTRQPENIVSLLNQRFDTMSEGVDGKLDTASKFARLMNTNTLFFSMHSGIHYVQTRVMLGMLHHIKAEGEGVKGSILDNYTVDPETKMLKMNENVTNWSMEDQTNFSARMHRLIASAHGDYTPLGQAAIQRVAMGRMVILFRKFIVPGFNRRWGDKQVNNLMDDNTEGYYRTFGRFAKQFMTDLIHFKFEAMQSFGGKKTLQEQANLARFATEAGLMATTIILASVAMQAKKDDPDKQDWVMNNLAFQALRLRAELGFYVDPMATLEIMKSPMASLSLIQSSIKLLAETMYPVYSGSFKFERYQAGHWKGHLKIEKTINSLVPVTKQYNRIKDIGDQLSYFNQ